jgi:PQ loop repeat
MPFLPAGEPLSTFLYPRLPFTDTSPSSTAFLHALDGGGGPNVPPSQGAFFGLAFSRLLGWLYFSCWIASFVPQTVINYRRKSVTGVSIDYICLNVAGFACYTVFNLSFLLSDTVREEYRQRHQ